MNFLKYHGPCNLSPLALHVRSPVYNLKNAQIRAIIPRRAHRPTHSYDLQIWPLSLAPDLIRLPDFTCMDPPRWRSLLRHCATGQKVVGSIPDDVIGIFH
jgi:hypothetical protein